MSIFFTTSKISSQTNTQAIVANKGQKRQKDEERWRVMKGAFLPFTLKPPVFIGILGEKMKGEG